MLGESACRTLKQFTRITFSFAQLNALSSIPCISQHKLRIEGMIPRKRKRYLSYTYAQRTYEYNWSIVPSLQAHDNQASCALWLASITKPPILRGLYAFEKKAILKGTSLFTAEGESQETYGKEFM